MSQYYEILGVDEDATQQDIKNAFKTRVKQVHPDHNDHPNAAQQFQQLKEAYDVLRDPESREKYDSDEFSESVNSGGPENTGSEKHSDPVSWTDNTRGSPEADYIWNNDTNRVAEPASSTSTGDRTMLQRGVGYFIAGGVPVGLGATVPFYALLLFYGAQGSFWLITVAMFIAMIICIYIAEAILQTDRRMPSP